MFCRFCGSENSNTAQFCIKCGKQLSKTSNSMDLHWNLGSLISGSFWLVALAGIFPALITLFLGKGVPLYYNSLTIELISNLIGLLVLIVLVVLRKVDVQSIGAKNIIVVCLLNILCADPLGTTQIIADLMGAVGFHAFGFFSSLRSIIALPDAFRWFLICIYLVVISNKGISFKRLFVITGVLLIVWSAILALLSSPIAQHTNAITYYIEPELEIFLLSFSLLMWLTRLIGLYSTIISGKHYINTGITSLCVALKTILAPVIAVQTIQAFGPAGLLLGEAFAYLALGAICLTIYMLNTRKRTAV